MLSALRLRTPNLIRYKLTPKRIKSIAASGPVTASCYTNIFHLFALQCSVHWNQSKLVIKLLSVLDFCA